MSGFYAQTIRYRGKQSLALPTNKIKRTDDRIDVLLKTDDFEKNQNGDLTLSTEKFPAQDRFWYRVGELPQIKKPSNLDVFGEWEYHRTKYEPHAKATVEEIDAFWAGVESLYRNFKEERKALSPKEQNELKILQRTVEIPKEYFEAQEDSAHMHEP